MACKLSRLTFARSAIHACIRPGLIGDHVFDGCERFRRAIEIPSNDFVAVWQSFQLIKNYHHEIIGARGSNVSFCCTRPPIDGGDDEGVSFEVHAVNPASTGGDCIKVVFRRLRYGVRDHSFHAEDAYSG